MTLSIKIRSKQFDTPDNGRMEVLSDINFDLEPHDFLSIIGPSGCGKTTLLRILAGFDDDYTGEIVNSGGGSEPGTKFARLGNVGYVPQEFSLFPWLTVEDNIKFGLQIKNYSKEKQTKITNRLLDLVEMREFRRFYPKDISGGMKQKIAICRAIATNPASNLIVMDEPFSALDAQTRNEIQVDLLRIWREQQLCIVFVTHNIDESVFLSKRILVLGKTSATIQKVESVNLPYPRDRTSIQFNAIRKDLLALL